MLLTETLCHASRYLTRLLVNIAFIASQGHHELVPVVVIDHLIYPEVHAREALVVCQVIANYGRCCISIVERNHRPESLRTACVPDMQFDLAAVR